MDWRGRKVLITGGAGFIGSNLARALSLRGAAVGVLDNFLFEGGALSENLADVDVDLYREDIRYADLGGYLDGVDVLFNMAAQTGHIQAQRRPLEDLEINAVAQLRLIAAVRQSAPRALVVHASTRQVYGRPESLPVAETHPVRPPDANAVSKLAGETYWMLEHEVHGRRVVSLRLTNTYGPRQRIIDANQNFFGFWIGQALRGHPIEIWGGQQLRDLAYVDDVVDALIAAAEVEACAGRILNVGGGPPLSLQALAETLQARTGVTHALRPFPRENALIDIGSFYADDTAFRTLTGWAPKTDIDTGLAATLDWFAPRLDAYTGTRARTPTDPRVSPRSTYLADQAAIDAAIRRVMESGVYILGPEVEAFEHAFARWIGAPEMVACANGTDALVLALQACGVPPGAVVATVSHTAVATVAAVELAGCRPLLLDVDATYTLDVAELAAALAAPGGAEIAAVVVVHLYGQPADMAAITALCARHGVVLIEDCSQAHGAADAGRRVGSFGDAASFSFYPTKNLGAFGDGGAVAFRDPVRADEARLLRQYGWNAERDSQRPGRNSRLDELQAAILRVKLETLDAANDRRRAIAALYDAALADAPVQRPPRRAGALPVFHQYVIQCGDRDGLKRALAGRSIATAIHYPLPVHRQAAYLGRVALGPNRCRTTETICDRILSLPIGPQMIDADAVAVGAAVTELVRAFS